MYRMSQITLALTLCLGLTACREAPTPVAALRVAPSQIDLGFPHDETLTIELDMRQTLPAGVTPWVMVHLVDHEGALVRTFDHPLPGAWAPGESMSDTVVLYQSALAAPLAAGRYQLSLGLYDPAGGRWPLETDGTEIHADEYALATVEAAEGSDSAPKVFFSPTWMATEPGTDIQVLGRRWLRSEGAIRFSDLTVPGRARLVLRIAPPDPQLEDMVLDEGFAEAQLDVASSCGEETWTLSGIGTHVVEAPLGPTAEGGDCEISLTPHFKIVTRRNLNSRVLALDVLSWRAGAPAS